MNKLLSVIIPVYNREDKILNALNSIPNREDIEIIVIDDCSSDNTVKVLKQFNNIIIIELNENCGPGNARNKGLDIATGKFITFLDSDDWFNTDNLIKAINLLEEDQFDIYWFNNKKLSGANWKGSDDKFVFQGAIVRSEIIGDLRYETSYWGEERNFVEQIKLKTNKHLDNNYDIYVYNYRQGNKNKEVDTLTYKHLKENNWKW